MPLNSPGGSTLQWGMGRALLCWLSVQALFIPGIRYSLYLLTGQFVDEKYTKEENDSRKRFCKL